jgi:hypothetical protein
LLTRTQGETHTLPKPKPTNPTAHLCALQRRRQLVDAVALGALPQRPDLQQPDDLVVAVGQHEGALPVQAQRQHAPRGRQFDQVDDAARGDVEHGHQPARLRRKSEPPVVAERRRGRLRGGGRGGGRGDLDAAAGRGLELEGGEGMDLVRVRVDEARCAGVEAGEGDVGGARREGDGDDSAAGEGGLKGLGWMKGGEVRLLGGVATTMHSVCCSPSAVKAANTSHELPKTRRTLVPAATSHNVTVPSAAPATSRRPHRDHPTAVTAAPPPAPGSALASPPSPALASPAAASPVTSPPRTLAIPRVSKSQITTRPPSVPAASSVPWRLKAAQAAGPWRSRCSSK